MSPKKEKPFLTPLMSQYYKIKEENPGTILLFRMGDFYETFGEDAKKASKALGITLTKRNSSGTSANIPLAGFPYHALDNYLPKLVKAGFRVSICEQLEDPKQTQKIVKRGVTEVVTPGTLVGDNLLDHKSNNFLASVFIQKNIAGIAISDVSTGEFLIGEVDLQNLKQHLFNLSPSEILVHKKDKQQVENLVENTLLTQSEDWLFDYKFARENLLEHFQTHSLKGFGVDELKLAQIAAGVNLNYLKETRRSELRHINKLSLLTNKDFMILDSSTKRNLELVNSSSYGDRKDTLFAILDLTQTSMGGRLLVKWLNFPLIKVKQIEERLEGVSDFFENDSMRLQIRLLLGQFADLERLITKVAIGKNTPRDLVSIKESLKMIPEIKRFLEEAISPYVRSLCEKLTEITELISLLENALVENPAANYREGKFIRKGYNTELDELKTFSQNSKNWLKNYQNQEKEKTQISSLKVEFNKVFGYYINITKIHLDKVPEHYIRKQTLVNSERYITSELKEFEEKSLSSEEKMIALEMEIFRELCIETAKFIQEIQLNASSLARIDLLSNFAEISKSSSFTKPKISNSGKILIVGGRHPVVEKLLPLNENFVSNDTFIDREKSQILIVTGPNMAGKSTYLRQVGLIVLMAQVGCFVPAELAEIGVVDKIFTRVGASDNITSGESTFLVEMNETANILNNATPKSLILLDEIGRGTSTFDGLSIAWAVTEFLHNNKRVSARTIFATHYHELTDLEKLLERVKNYNVEVKEFGGKIEFVRKIIPGGCDHSYGIQVAEMAGLPYNVIRRAKTILKNLETNELNLLSQNSPNKSRTTLDQLSLFMDSQDKVEKYEAALDLLKEKIMEQEVNNLTPIEAMNFLSELQAEVKKNKFDLE